MPALRVGDLRDQAATVRALDALARYADPLLQAVDEVNTTGRSRGFDTGPGTTSPGT